MVPEPPARYRLRTKDQAGALSILRRCGALGQIERAVLAHCSQYAPEPPYKPQEIKRRLKPDGWIPEVRVRPYDPQHDELPINDRYDLWKPFDLDGQVIGVAIEIEKWEVWNDLLKFRRGLHRGQIAAGVILHDCPANLAYVHDHLRHLAGPLFDDLPVLFVAPEGQGLAQAFVASKRKYAPYRMPDDPT